MSQYDEVLTEAGIIVINVGWYFLTFTWEDEHGPYLTEEACREGEEKYFDNWSD